MRTSLRLLLLSTVCLTLIGLLPAAFGAAGQEPVTDEPMSGTVRLDPGTPGYLLDQGYGRRSVDFEVRFDERYARPPGVAVKLVHVEAAPGEKRVSVKVKQVFESGFILRATTWGDAAIHAVEVDWTATPQ